MPTVQKTDAATLRRYAAAIDDRLTEDDMPPVQKAQPQTDQTERLLTLARAKGFAATADDVRRRFGDQPVTADSVLQALAGAASEPSMEVNATTPDAELDAFLFGE